MDDVSLGGLGKRLGQARIAAGYECQEDAAKATGVPFSSLKKWESATVEPGAVRLAKLAQKFGCSLDWLLGMTDYRTGVPVGETIVDMNAVRRVEECRSLEEIDDLLDICDRENCGYASVLVANQLPDGYEIKPTAEVVRIQRRVSSKLRVLNKRKESG